MVCAEGSAGTAWRSASVLQGMSQTGILQAHSLDLYVLPLDFDLLLAILHKDDGNLPHAVLLPCSSNS